MFNFLMRLLTVIELMLLIKRYKEGPSNEDVLQPRENADPIHSQDRPARSNVLDNVPTKSNRHKNPN